MSWVLKILRSNVIIFCQTYCLDLFSLFSLGTWTVLSIDHTTLAELPWSNLLQIWLERNIQTSSGTNSKQVKGQVVLRKRPAFALGMHESARPANLRMGLKLMNMFCGTPQLPFYSFGLKSMNMFCARELPWHPNFNLCSWSSQPLQRIPKRTQ